MVKGALALLLLLAACSPSGLPTNLAHAFSDNVQPGAPYQGDMRVLAQQIHHRYQHGYHYRPSKFGNYWPTREETRQARAADCKGFAIAAYDDALEAGVPDDKLAVWVVVILRTGETHAVLIMGDLVVDRYLDKVYTVDQASSAYYTVGKFNRKGLL